MRQRSSQEITGPTGDCQGEPQFPMEMAIPFSYREKVLAFLLFLIFAISLPLSLANLFRYAETPPISIAASSFWIIFTFYITAREIKSYGGFYSMLASLAGIFSFDHFMKLEKQVDETVMVCYGCHCFNRAFFFVRIQCDRVMAVEWSKGQASAMYGSDMNDWCMAVFIDSGTPCRKLEILSIAARHGLFIVGPSGSLKNTGALGHSLIEFLSAVGIKLVPGPSENRFVRETSRPLV